MKIIKPEQASAFAPHPWKISEESYSQKNNLFGETIFTLSNGYLGIRGSFEEGFSGSECRTNNGIYINGFYESVPIPHAERGFGYAENTQTMLNVTDSRIIELFIEDERFNMDSGTLLNYRRTLDMREGYIVRDLTWRSPKGREIQIIAKRMVSYENRHLAAFEYQVVPLNFSAPMVMRSALNGAVDNHRHEEEDPRFQASLGGLGLSVIGIRVENENAVMAHQTQRSQLQMACAMANRLKGVNDYNYDIDQVCDFVSVNYRFEGRENEPVTLEKYIAYYTSREYPEAELSALAEKAVINALDKGFGAILAQQGKILQNYWEGLGLEMENDPYLSQGINYNLFHLFQASGVDGKRGIGAKGLSSEGYDGHYFWDTEIYMFPFYCAVLPATARKLLEYRYSILDFARQRARELAHPHGALYPWRTIAGEEGSSYYPAGTAQYHINAAIAYAVCKYIEMTGDYNYMLEEGAEIIFETARLWADLGFYVARKGNLFCFHEITGPDEYTALVNNNCYTNLMAAWHLAFAARTVSRLQEEYPSEYKRIAAKINLDQEEPLNWQKAADNIYIPYDEALQIHPQDDSFLDKEIWDFAATPADKYPLLLHYHPLVIYRYQVCKQPDIILAHLLLGEGSNLEQKKRDYKYYEPITTHDSSLSPAIFGTVAAELDFEEDALRFFALTARLDLDNLLKDTHFGVHLANMAGSWICLVYGFGGMRTYDGQLRFMPKLPGGWQGYRFKVKFQGKELAVRVSRQKITYKLLDGDHISFRHKKTLVELSSGEVFEATV